MYFRFRKFPIYKELRLFIKDVYKIVNTLPDNEKYALASQLKRAATSILLNLAEGSMRGSDPEFHRFLLISIASLGEVVAILDVCLDNNYISPSIHEEFMVKCEGIEKQLFSFSKTLKR